MELARVIWKRWSLLPRLLISLMLIRRCKKWWMYDRHVQRFKHQMTISKVTWTGLVIRLPQTANISAESREAPWKIKKQSTILEAKNASRFSLIPPKTPNVQLASNLPSTKKKLNNSRVWVSQMWYNFNTKLCKPTFYIQISMYESCLCGAVRLQPVFTESFLPFTRLYFFARLWRHFTNGTKKNYK